MGWISFPPEAFGEEGLVFFPPTLSCDKWLCPGYSSPEMVLCLHHLVSPSSCRFRFAYFLLTAPRAPHLISDVWDFYPRDFKQETKIDGLITAVLCEKSVRGSFSESFWLYSDQRWLVLERQHSAFTSFFSPTENYPNRTIPYGTYKTHPLLQSLF